VSEPENPLPIPATGVLRLEDARLRYTPDLPGYSMERRSS